MNNGNRKYRYRCVRGPVASRPVVSMKAARMLGVALSREHRGQEVVMQRQLLCGGEWEPTTTRFRDGQQVGRHYA